MSDNIELDWASDLDALKAEAQRSGYKDWVDWAISICPVGDWPGRQVVDLDDTGDPGMWLEANLVVDVLFNDSSEVDAATQLAESFFQAHADIFLESWEDLCESKEDYQNLVALVEDDFFALIQEWRKQVWEELKNIN